MSKLERCLVLVCLFLVAACLVPGQGAGAADGEKGDEAFQKRAALWAALLTALPEEYKAIDAYAENPSLSAVLFRSKGATLMFSLRTGKVEAVRHMKALIKINRITYEEREAGGYWALWYNGRRELTISAEK